MDLAAWTPQTDEIPRCSNLGPVKAVRHRGGGWVASEAESGRESG